MIDFTKDKVTGKVVVIFGFRGTGKSVFARKLLAQFGAEAFYYDTLHESPPSAKYRFYKPIDRYSTPELEAIIKAVMESHAYRFAVIDEANRYCPSKPTPLPKAIADLNDWCRHQPYNMGAGFICRRPSQLNQDITELADYIVIFRLGGRADIKYLNEIADNLGDNVRLLKPYHFLLVKPDRTYVVCKPIEYTKDITDPLADKQAKYNPG